MNNEKIQTAADMFNVLLQNRQVTEKDNRTLFNLYLYDEEIQTALNSILEGVGLYLYRFRDGLYISTKKDNKVFGYSNEELRAALGLKNNNQLYLCYFIMYIAITSFYNESSYITPLMYIRNITLMERVTENLKALSSDKEDYEEEGFYYMNKIWNEYVDIPINSGENDSHERQNTNSKIGLVNRVLQFMLDDGLLRKSAEERIYEPTDRFRAVIANYYNDKENRIFLNGLINS